LRYEHIGNVFSFGFASAKTFRSHLIICMNNTAAVEQFKSSKKFNNLPSNLETGRVILPRNQAGSTTAATLKEKAAY
jgi:hypothetical protein